MKTQALASFLSIDVSDITETTYNTYEAEGAEYEVLTDDEAYDKWDEALESYIEECILPELPANLANYFDSEKWKQDAQYDGRGHSLATYDGEENEETIDNVVYYIYRVN